MNAPITIDCHYLAPRFAAAFLVVEGDRAAFVENNTSNAFPYLMDALKAVNLRPENVDWCIITHVHLDHAGGSAKLMEACPNATLLAHPRAAPHVIDPGKLEASARKVYGNAEFERLYGKVGPVDSKRVRVMEDGEQLNWGHRTLRFMHTRGHANHHFCVVDSGSRSIFTGDSFGLCYPVLQEKGLFIFPSTSPTDFDPKEARATIQRILDTGAQTALLTHFGPVKQLKEASAQLTQHLDFSEQLLEEAQKSAEPDDKLDAFCTDRLRPYFMTQLRNRGLTPDDATMELLRLDIDLNAQGIAHVARKRRAPKRDETHTR